MQETELGFEPTQAACRAQPSPLGLKGGGACVGILMPRRHLARPAGTSGGQAWRGSSWNLEGREAKATAKSLPAHRKGPARSHSAPNVNSVAVKEDYLSATTLKIYFVFLLNYK